MPGLSGIDLRRELRLTDLVLPIIFVTGHGDIPMTVKAMKAGAMDFLPKPVRDADLLRALEQTLLRARQEGAERDELADIQRRLMLSLRANAK